MEIINLTAYIAEGLFLEEGKMPHDLIVWEKLPEGFIPDGEMHKTLGDISYDFGFSGKMEALCAKHQRILLIVESINTLYLLPWISTLEADKNVTIVTLSGGIASYANKAQPEMSDVMTVMPFMRVCEVYDKDSLERSLLMDGKNYIRVPQGETHTSLFPKAIPVEKGIGDLTDLGFEGVAGTIIAPGGVLVNAIHAVQHLQSTEKSFDLFVLEEYDFEIGKALKDSIIKTENIILLLDQRYGTQYPAILKAKLWDAGLVDTETHVFYPAVDKINTILPEYIREQAQWDGLGIAEKINSIN